MRSGSWFQELDLRLKAERKKMEKTCNPKIMITVDLLGMMASSMMGFMAAERPRQIEIFFEGHRQNMKLHYAQAGCEEEIETIIDTIIDRYKAAVTDFAKYYREEKKDAE